MDKVSVIVPVYNLAPYIADCLSSICNQTYRELEIIVVDDGSTDDSVKICNAIAKNDLRIKIIQKENGGVSSARNRGIEEATGKYIMFIDGDDICHSTMITHLHSMMDDGISLARCRFFTANRNEVTWPQHSYQCSTYNRIDFCRMILNGRAEATACASLFQRSLIGSLRFREDIARNEDKLFLFAYVSQCDGSVVFSEATLYAYLMRAGSASRSGFTKNIYDYIEACQSMCDITQSVLPELMQDADLNLQNARIDVLKTVIENDVYSEEKEHYKSIRKEIIQNYQKNCSRIMRLEQYAIISGVRSFSFFIRLYRRLTK